MGSHHQSESNKLYAKLWKGRIMSLLHSSRWETIWDQFTTINSVLISTITHLNFDKVTESVESYMLIKVSNSSHFVNSRLRFNHKDTLGTLRLRFSQQRLKIHRHIRISKQSSPLNVPILSILLDISVWPCQKVDSKYYDHIACVPSTHV